MEKINFDLQSGYLYILSGLPGSGKSSFTQSLPANVVLSTDKLRESILGYRTMGSLQWHLQSGNVAVFSALRTMLQARLTEKLTTVLDAMNLTEADRAEFVKMAKEAGVPVEVLIFDRPLEVCLERNRSRAARLEDRRIGELALTFQRTSAHPYRLVPDGAVARVVPRSLPGTAIDVVGDIHGLFDDLLELLGALGYQIENGVPVHPQGRKLLFLGDTVDRGPQSIEVLQFVARAVKAGHFMVIGNHEHKLVKFWRSYRQGQPEARSSSAAETAVKFLMLADKEREALFDFLISLPGYYTLEAGGKKLAFVHANLTHFAPESILHSECMYGSEELPAWVHTDSDAIYADHFAKGYHDHWLIRGHIADTSIQQCVFSLERDQAYAGHLAALRLDDFLAKCESMVPRAAFEQSLVLKKCEFNFDEHSKRFALQKGMRKLVEEKLATAALEKESGLQLFKYSKSVFYEAKWDASPWLKKARGLVLDLAGNVVVNPFDKVFNYGEQNAGVDILDDQEVIEVEKLNGFLGCISKHPYKHDLLCTTTGSFDSDFVGYIKSFIDGKQRGRFLKFFSKNAMTLMFEVIHQDDPHIIPYDAKDHGLWLIGARGLAPEAEPVTEEELDRIAAELEVGRPSWAKTTFGALKQKVVTSKLEGYMVRDAKTQDTLLKFKTPYYLVTKFLGRLSDPKIRFMFGNPQVFKKDIDEEFYPLVDLLTTKLTREEFSAMEDDDRVTLVRGLIAELR